MRALYVTHPQVQMNANIPVPLWELSAEGRRRAEAHGDVGLAHVQRAGVGVAVDGDGAHPEPAQRAHDPHGDLATVGDQDRLEHGSHILKTP